MTSTTALVLCIAAIVASILLGFFLKVNVGICGMVFAFIIGVLCMKMKVNTIVGYWPINMLYIMTMIAIFYGFAKQNGTIEVLGKKMLSLMHGKSSLLLPVTALACIPLGMVGAHSALIIGPLVFAIAIGAGQSLVPLGIVLSFASFLGSANPWTGSGGIISSGLIEKAGYENYFGMATAVYGNESLKNILICIIVYVFYRCYKNTKLAELEDVPEMTPVQKKNAWLILSTLIAMLLPAVLKAIFPKVVLFKTLATFLCIQTVMPIAILLAVLMKLGTFNVAIKNVPQSAIILIAGMSMLMGVAKEAGLIDVFASFLTDKIPGFLIAPCLVLIGAFLSFFSGGMTVVVPLLYPLAATIAQSTGLNAILLFSCVQMGAMSSCISPFSSGGAEVLSVVPNQDLSDSMVGKLAAWAVVLPIILAVLAALGLFSIIPALCGGASFVY